MGVLKMLENKKKMTKEEFEVVKERVINELGLKQIPDERYADYYFDEEAVELYSMKRKQILKLKIGHSFGDYLFYNLTPKGSKNGDQDTVYLHWISHSVHTGVPIGAWREGEKGKKVTIHHRDGDIFNNHYSNITPTLNQHDLAMRKRMSEARKGRTPIKISDEDVIYHRERQKELGIAVTTYARMICDDYKMDAISVYKILAGKSRTNIAI